MVPCFPRVVCLSLTTYQDLDHISRENKTQGPNSESTPSFPRRESQHSVEGPLQGKGFYLWKLSLKEEKKLVRETMASTPTKPDRDPRVSNSASALPDLHTQVSNKTQFSFRKVQRTEIFRFQELYPDPISFLNLQFGRQFKRQKESYMAKIIINEYLTLVCYLIAYQFPTPPCLSLSVLVSQQCWNKIPQTGS